MTMSSAYILGFPKGIVVMTLNEAWDLGYQI